MCACLRESIGLVRQKKEKKKKGEQDPKENSMGEAQSQETNLYVRGMSVQIPRRGAAGVEVKESGARPYFMIRNGNLIQWVSASQTLACIQVTLRSDSNSGSLAGA